MGGVVCARVVILVLVFINAGTTNGLSLCQQNFPKVCHTHTRTHTHKHTHTHTHTHTQTHTHTHTHTQITEENGKLVDCLKKIF